MRRVLVIATATVLALVVGTVAWASIPGSDGLIYGCRKNTDGSLRVVDSAASCPSGYTALNWRQGGLANVHVVTAVVPFSGSSPVEQDVSCPPGEVALSAVVQAHLLDGSRALNSSGFQGEPILQGATPTGYHLSAAFISNGPLHFNVTCSAAS